MATVIGRSAAAGLALVLLPALAACAAPAPQRVILEDQVRAYVDAVMADPSNAAYRREPAVRAGVEADGRAVCSHLVAGVPLDRAYRAAFPEGNPYSHNAQMLVREADRLLCPLR